MSAAQREQRDHFRCCNNQNQSLSASVSPGRCSSCRISLRFTTISCSRTHAAGAARAAAVRHRGRKTARRSVGALARGGGRKKKRRVRLKQLLSGSFQPVCRFVFLPVEQLVVQDRGRFVRSAVDAPHCCCRCWSTLPIYVAPAAAAAATTSRRRPSERPLRVRERQVRE